MSDGCYGNPEGKWHAFNREYDYFNEEEIDVYCDGAASHNGYDGASAGWGIYFKDPCYHYLNAGGPVSGDQTNQRAELTAILEALKRAPDEEHLVIHTDSQYALDCLTNWLDRWLRNGWMTSTGKPVANRDLIEDIIDARQNRGPKVILKHVRGHSGDPGNTAADIIAKNASRGYYE